MTHGKTFVLVHGIGSVELAEKWLDPLNATLASLGSPVIGSRDRVIVVDYKQALLHGDEDEAPPVTWSSPPEQVQLAQWYDFVERKEALALQLGVTGVGARALPWGVFGGDVVSYAAHGPARVRRYLTESRCRNAVWRSVLAQLPDSGDIVAIGHSLGAIVLTDLLKRLPHHLHVALLLTLGAPFGVGDLRRHNGGLESATRFPADRVEAWINVFDPGDLVTVGKGAQRYFSAALDLVVDTGGAHSLSGYMAQPAVGAALVQSVFGIPQVPSERTPARPFHEQWKGLMIRFAYTQHLWATLPPDKWRTRIRMDLARRTLAAQAVAEAIERRERLAAEADGIPSDVRDFLSAQAAELPFAPGRMPTEADLWRHSADHLRNEFTDERLVFEAVDLLLSEPLAPFSMAFSQEHMASALVSLLDRIRQDTSTLSSQEIVRAVAGELKAAKKAMEDGKTPWGPILVGAGVVVLAATGIGLAVAVPTGLAGAAAIAATLATFGPGGMAGGVATLAVLTGTSAALTTAGFAAGSAGDQRFARLQGQMLIEVASYPKAAFRSAMAGILATTAALEVLGKESRIDEAERTLQRILATVQERGLLHKSISPDSAPAKEWQAKADITLRALAWLAQRFPSAGIVAATRGDYERAIQSGASWPSELEGVRQDPSGHE